MPFAYDLVHSLRPCLIVELGTHCGDSYFTFCQAVKDAGLPTVVLLLITGMEMIVAADGAEVYQYVSHYNKSFESFLNCLVCPLMTRLKLSMTALFPSCTLMVITNTIL